MSTHPTAVQDVSRWGRSIRPYAEWIVAEDQAEASEWEHRIRSRTSSTVEGAVAEAVAWDYINHRVCEIRRFPDPGPGKKRPDFLCKSNSVEFAVEVKNLSRDRVSRLTGLDDPMLPRQGLTRFRPWDRELKTVLTGKAAQGKALTTPYLVFVTTLHEEASATLCSKSYVEMLLHSRTHISGSIDAEGNPVGDVQIVTDMATAAFTRKHSLTPGRQHISAMLVGGFGTYPEVRVLGLLHPEALRPIRPEAIGETPFCYWLRWPPGAEVEIGWSDEADSTMASSS